MGGLPFATRAGTAVLVIVTVGAFLVSLGSEPSVSERDLVVAAMLGAMIALAEIFVVSFPHSAGTFHLSVGSPIALAAGLTLGPVLGATVVMLAILFESVYGHRAPIKTIVNVATLGLVTLLAALAYRWLADGDLTPLGGVRNMASVVAASLVFTLVNASVLSAIVAPIAGMHPLRMLRTNLSGVYVQM
ncbi:MAG: hypothetical protein H0T91_08450, partial [Propionibacteriaceae bacterium]|nr:hypothetical protein [Propionibacteriaceae bacterium]